jgi:hypothetical protein
VEQESVAERSSSPVLSACPRRRLRAGSCERIPRSQALAAGLDKDYPEGKG